MGHILDQTYFRPDIFYDNSLDGVLVSQTRGGSMDGADKSTELWRVFS